jgi:hypothetical protein
VCNTNALPIKPYSLKIFIIEYNNLGPTANSSTVTLLQLF